MVSAGDVGVSWVNSAPKASVAAKVNKSLSVQLNGEDAITFDGSSEQNINITPEAIGAASSDNAVNLSDSQTITGDKTFTSAVTIKSSSNRTKILSYPVDVVTT